jgi:serine/threonine-protein kinase RsbT
MLLGRSETLPIRDEPDLVLVRQHVGRLGDELGFTTLVRAKIVTAASELGRNTLTHGRGGSVRIEILTTTDRAGLRLTFEDTGPGIPDVPRAMKDGFTTARGLGLGLGGSRRLVDKFEIASSLESGTRVTVTQWASA